MRSLGGSSDVSPGCDRRAARAFETGVTVGTAGDAAARISAAVAAIGSPEARRACQIEAEGEQRDAALDQAAARDDRAVPVGGTIASSAARSATSRGSPVSDAPARLVT